MLGGIPLQRSRGSGRQFTQALSAETRGCGWKRLHAAIDDHSYISFSQFQPEERAIEPLAA